MKPTAALSAFAVASVFLLTGCTSTQGLDNFERPEIESVEVLPDPPAEYVDPPAIDRWECHWDPTMNEDWHDDVVCTNGAAVDRPYLIPGDTFVEQWEIEEAAVAHELELNS